eukprot:3460523-Heterocapsa_arctica.AAC.1
MERASGEIDIFTLTAGVLNIVVLLLTKCRNEEVDKGCAIVRASARMLLTVFRAAMIEPAAGEIVIFTSTAGDYDIIVLLP